MQGLLVLPLGAGADALSMLISSIGESAQAREAGSGRFVTFRGMEGEESRPDDPQKGSIVFWKLGDKDVQEIAVGFLGHGFAQNPVLISSAATLQQRGPHGVIFDLEKAKITARLQAPDKHRWFGHLTYSHDGERIFASAMDDQANQGVIVVLNAKTGQMIDRFSCFGLGPHESLLEGSDLIVVTCGLSLRNSKAKSYAGSEDRPSGRSTVNWIDVQSHKLRRQVVLAARPQRYGHFRRDSLGGHIVTGQGNPEQLPDADRKDFPGGTVGLLSTVGSSGDAKAIVSMENHRRDFGEVFNVEIMPDQRTAFIASESTDMLFSLDYRKGVLTPYVSIPGPLGLVRRDDKLFVSTNENRLYAVDLKSKAVERVPGMFGNGPHLYWFA